MMNTAGATDAFYGRIPVFRGFSRLMDPKLYVPLPDDWTIGVADIVESTKAIAAQRYKAVNMAGAAVIAALTNALGGREFPFVFGGDGASFAVAPQDLALAREALAATATWVQGRPGPHDADRAGAGVGDTRTRARRPRRALRPIDESVLRDVHRRRARLGRCSDEARRICRWRRRRRHAARSVRPVVPFRGNPFDARRHAVGAGAAGEGRRREPVSQDDRRHFDLVERSPDAGRPVPSEGPPLRWPPQGVEYETRAMRGGSLAKRRAVVLAVTLWAYVVMRLGIKVGNFVPRNYVQQVVENSDFRKYDDGLKMILDCTEELEQALSERLAAAASAGILRYGLHRQDAAMMTCFVPSVMRSDHVHFIDGARGGYATAATALKASAA